MSAVDRYGFEMIAVSPAGRAVRLAFPSECLTGDEVREAMVAMVARRARVVTAPRTATATSTRLVVAESARPTPMPRARRGARRGTPCPTRGGRRRAPTRRRDTGGPRAGRATSRSRRR